MSTPALYRSTRRGGLSTPLEAGHRILPTTPDVPVLCLQPEDRAEPACAPHCQQRGIDLDYAVEPHTHPTDRTHIFGLIACLCAFFRTTVEPILVERQQAVRACVAKLRVFGGGSRIQRKAHSTGETESVFLGPFVRVMYRFRWFTMASKSFFLFRFLVRESRLE